MLSLIAAGHPAFGAVADRFDEYRTHYGEAADPAATRAWLTDQVTSERLSITAALDGDRVVGLITTTVLPASLRLGTAWMIRDLYVAPDHRRRGLARDLLLRVIAAGREAGAVRV